MRVSSFWQSFGIPKRQYRTMAYCKKIMLVFSFLCCANTFAETSNDHFSLDQLIEQVDSFLQNHFLENSLNDGSRIAIKVSNLDPRLQLAACSSPLTFDLRDSGSSGGNVSVHTRCQGSTPWAVYIPAEVQILLPVITAARNLERGSTLSDADFDSQWLDTSALNNNYVTDSSRLLGKSTSRRIRAGEAIRLSSVSEPIAVKRGDAVMVEAQSGSIVVSTQAIALSDGRVGEQISVRNSQSERIVRVKIMGPGRGRVIL